MKIDVSDEDEIHVAIGHDCGTSKEPYVAIDGSFDRPGLALLTCENCGKDLPLAAYPTDAEHEMTELVTAWGVRKQTEEKRREDPDFTAKED